MHKKKVNESEYQTNHKTPLDINSAIQQLHTKLHSFQLDSIDDI